MLKNTDHTMSDINIPNEIVISTGITDRSTKPSLVIEDEKILVKNASIDTIEGKVTVRGDVKIYGILDAGLVRTTEILANQRYEKQFLEFAGINGESSGTGLLWRGGKTRQLVFRQDPDVIFSSENINIPSDKNYMIGGTPVINVNSLGNDIVNSNLNKLGTLKSLHVDGEINVGDHIFYNPVSQRFSLGTDEANGLFSIYDFGQNVEIIIDSTENGGGKIGTYGTKDFSLVTDNQARITILNNGNVTIGQENKDNTITRIYGKLSVGVKNPTEQLEVSGNIKMGNRLFTNGDRPPTDGTYQKGDIVWNSNPRPTTHIGWVCVANGSPGTWKPFGLIEG